VWLLNAQHLKNVPPVERRPRHPAGKIRLDRVQLGVADLDHGQVVAERLGHGGLVEPLGSQPGLVGVGLGRPAPPGPPVAQQELAEPVPRPGEVLDHVGSGAAQIPHRLLLEGGDADSHQLAGAVQPGQPAAVPPVGLDLVARCPGDQRRGDHLAADPHALQQPGQPEAGRAGLVAGSQHPGITQAADEPADRHLVVDDPLDVGDLLVGSEDPRRDGVPMDVQAEMDRGKLRDTGHGRLLPYGGSARSVWVTHADADRSRPFHAD
jgi:hypothetical protein